MRTIADKNRGTVTTGLGALALLFAAVLPLLAAEPVVQKSFATPQAAWQALVGAAEKNDTAALKEVFGPGSNDLISSGDEVADENVLVDFLAHAKEKTVFTDRGKDMKVVVIGKDDWPFPVPLVKDAKGWRFDTAVGMEEVVNRRIGKNELYTIEVLRAMVEAQEQFAAMHKEPHYAQKFVSSEGSHDGLFWKVKEGEEESPLGPLAAEAMQEGYGGAKEGEGPRPYHGYYFKILTAQGKEAPGGEKSYIGKDGRMTGGFAFVACPANYGASGVMTFIVNRQGIVFQKDLGEKTHEVVKAMTAYNPNETWAPVKD